MWTGEFADKKTANNEVHLYTKHVGHFGYCYHFYADPKSFY